MTEGSPQPDRLVKPEHQTKLEQNWGDSPFKWAVDDALTHFNDQPVPDDIDAFFQAMNRGAEENPTDPVRGAIEGGRQYYNQWRALAEVSENTREDNNDHSAESAALLHGTEKLSHAEELRRVVRYRERWQELFREIWGVEAGPETTYEQIDSDSERYPNPTAAKYMLNQLRLAQRLEAVGELRDQRVDIQWADAVPPGVLEQVIAQQQKEGTSLEWFMKTKPRGISTERYQNIVDQLVTDQPQNVSVDMLSGMTGLVGDELSQLVNSLERSGVISAANEQGNRTMTMDLPEWTAMQGPLVLSNPLLGNVSSEQIDDITPLVEQAFQSPDQAQESLRQRGVSSTDDIEISLKDDGTIDRIAVGNGHTIDGDLSHIDPRLDGQTDVGSIQFLSDSVLVQRDSTGAAEHIAHNSEQDGADIPDSPEPASEPRAPEESPVEPGVEVDSDLENREQSGEPSLEDQAQALLTAMKYQTHQRWSLRRSQETRAQTKEFLDKIDISLKHAPDSTVMAERLKLIQEVKKGLTKEVGKLEGKITSNMANWSTLDQEARDQHKQLGDELMYLKRSVAPIERYEEKTKQILTRTEAIEAASKRKKGWYEYVLLSYPLGQLWRLNRRYGDLLGALNALNDIEYAGPGGANTIRRLASKTGRFATGGLRFAVGTVGVAAAAAVTSPLWGSALLFKWLQAGWKARGKNLISNFAKIFGTET